jgi:DNA-binding CsgD family transcriptional regulator
MTKLSEQMLAKLERENIELRAKVETLEALVQGAMRSQIRPTEVDPSIDAKLSRLTLKQHAVVLGTLGGMTYQDLAALFHADDSTVKLHLKAALTHLGVQSRNHMNVTLSGMFNAIPEEEYLRKYGISKTWWINPDDELLAKLRFKRSSLYTPPAPRPKRKGGT